MRDAEKTREKILEAAEQEFSREGFAGARVDEIAAVAGCNKQLIYRYFTDKQGLFEAVVVRVMVHRQQRFLEQGLPKFPDHVQQFFPIIGEDLTWLRILHWESLAFGERPILAEEERKKRFEMPKVVAKLMQEAGYVDPQLESEHVLFLTMCTVFFPWAFPQLARLVTGRGPSDPVFQQKHIATVKRMLLGLHPNALVNVPDPSSDQKSAPTITEVIAQMSPSGLAAAPLPENMKRTHIPQEPSSPPSASETKGGVSKKSAAKQNKPRAKASGTARKPTNVSGGKRIRLAFQAIVLKGNTERSCFQKRAPRISKRIIEQRYTQ